MEAVSVLVRCKAWATDDAPEWKHRTRHATREGHGVAHARALPAVQCAAVPRNTHGRLAGQYSTVRTPRAARPCLGPARKTSPDAGRARTARVSIAAPPINRRFVLSVREGLNGLRVRGGSVVQSEPGRRREARRLRTPRPQNVLQMTLHTGLEVVSTLARCETQITHQNANNRLPCASRNSGRE